MPKSRVIRTISGIVLIFTGFVLVLSNLGYIDSVDFLWDLLFAFLGTYLYYTAFKKQVVFEGFLASFLFPVGSVGLLYEFQILNNGIAFFWPLCFIFFALYLIYIYSKTRSRLYLFMLSVFMMIGVVIQLRFFGIIPFSLREMTLKLWPLLFVLAGIYFLRGIVQRREKKNF
jgi:hypothetical protein